MRSTRRWMVIMRAPIAWTAVAVAFAVAVCVGVQAQPQPKPLTDVKGSKDPAAIKRYEGSVIIGYKFSKFDEFTFMTGPLARSTAGGSATIAPSKTERAEGQYTRLVYVAPEGRSPLEIVRNYQQELAAAGFTVVYQCARAECGGNETEMTDRTLYTMENRLANYPPSGSGSPPGQVTETAFGNAQDGRFFVAKRTGGGGNAWISVYAAINGFQLFKETFGRPVILVDLVEGAGMETKMVTVDASAMAKGIATHGHVALYGILFDTDKTDIKPESATTITEIARFLKQDPGVKLYVVGHTDNVGVYDYNMGLSQRRAASVVTELTTKHGIAAARMKPAGSGPLSPVAPNETEDGRAKNRRVELVKQ